MCLGLEIGFSRVGVRVRSGCGLKVGLGLGLEVGVN